MGLVRVKEIIVQVPAINASETEGNEGSDFKEVGIHPLNMTNKPLKILWGSEQPIRPTGYAIVSRQICKRLVEMGHEVYVMGWDYNGEPMQHEEGWTMVHAGIGGYSTERMGGPGTPTVLEHHLMNIQPDIYVSLIDPWFIGQSVISTNALNVPYIAYLPIDGFPISYAWKDILKMVHTPLWMSHFGKSVFDNFIDTFSSSGSTTPQLRDPVLDRYHSDDSTSVLYHGVDLETFKPLDEKIRKKVKSALGIKWEFCFHSVARNTNRKQQPRLLQAFKQFLDRETVDSSKVGLLLHVGDATDSMGMGGWNLPLMIKQMGLEGNVAFTDPGTNPLYGLSPVELATTYAIADVHVLSTAGEGFGIPSAEAMACGRPIILPNNSTGPELVGVDNPTQHEVIKGDRGWLVPCKAFLTGPKFGVSMGIVDIDMLEYALFKAYCDEKSRDKLGKNARKWAEKNLDWDDIAKDMESLIRKSIADGHALGDLSSMMTGE